MINYNWSRREKILASSLAVVSLLFISSFFWGKKEPDPLEAALKNVGQQEESVASPKKEDSRTEELWVDVKGGVQKPGIYKVKPNTRVFQVIEEAGGTVETANTNQMNLAQAVTDGMVVYIPQKGEKINVFMEQGNQTSTQSTSSGSGGKMNINTATEQELQTLSGIGPAKAKTIVQYRNEHGKFTSVEDLKKISGLGEKTIARFQEQITVGN